MDKYTLNYKRLTKAEKLIHLALKSGTLYSWAFAADSRNAQFLTKASIHLLHEAIVVQSNYVKNKDSNLTI